MHAYCIALNCVIETLQSCSQCSHRCCCWCCHYYSSPSSLLPIQIHSKTRTPSLSPSTKNRSALDSVIVVSCCGLIIMTWRPSMVPPKNIIQKTVRKASSPLLTYEFQLIRWLDNKQLRWLIRHICCFWCCHFCYWWYLLRSGFFLLR